MSSSELGRMLRSFPWDLCRSVYTNPMEKIPYVVSGVSFDWEHLLLSSFIDAKTLIREWLLFKRIFSKPDDIDFSDLQVTPAAEGFRRMVLARSVLYQEFGYFDMAAMAYLYMCSVYAEERETLAVFTAFWMESDAALDRKASTTSSTGSAEALKFDAKAVPHLVFPDWPTLSRWLRCSVEADLQSAPALLAAAALYACYTTTSSNSSAGASIAVGPERFSVEAARRILQHQLASPVPSPPSTSTGKRSAAECAAAAPAAKVQAVAHEAPGIVKSVVAAAQPPPSQVAVPPAPTSNAVDDQRYQHAQQLLQLQTAVTVAAYRDNPNQHFTTARAQALRAGTGVPATGPGHDHRAAYSYPAHAPVMTGVHGGRAFPAAGPGSNHPAAALFGTSGAGAYAAFATYDAFATHYRQQRGDGALRAPAQQTSFAYAAALTQASANFGRSDEPRGLPDSCPDLESAAGGSSRRSAARVPPQSVGASQHRVDSMSALPAPARTTSAPKPLSFSEAYAAGNCAAPSQQPLPVAQAAQILQTLAGSSAQPSLQPHAALVNRRQKKNRDKFRVTFQMSAARASELQLLRGILLNAPPSSPTLAGAGAASHSVLVPLKGIDVLANGRYRVQLNTFMSGRKKFSRNSTDLYEALWIFEIALLISDSPSLLSELQRIGNYNCLAPLGHLGFFANPREYYLELGRHILLFYDTVDFFNEDLITLAIQNYNALRPAVAVMPPGPLPSSQQPNPVKSEFADCHQPHSRPHHMSSGNTVSTVATTVASRDTSDDDELSTGPAVSGCSAASDRACPLSSRYEALGPLAWMAGFEAGRSLQDQQLSCLFCLRSLPAPTWLPRIVMVKEDKGPQAASGIGAVDSTPTAAVAGALQSATAPNALPA